MMKTKTTSPQPTTNRTKQFRRQPQSVPPIVIWTDRDDKILSILARFRYANAEHIHTFVGGSYRRLQSRLQQLYHHGHLDRPPKQISLWRSGRLPFIYSLGDKGASHLRRSGVEIVGRDKPRYWYEKNRNVGHAHILHTITTTSFAVQLSSAGTKRHVDTRWLREGKQLKDTTTYTRRDPRTKRTSKRKGSINPDGFAHLRWKKPDGGTRNRYFFVEIDTGSEPNSRDTSYGTDIRSKMEAYAQWGLVEKRHRERFNIPGFVVLFATTASETRVNNMLALAKAIDPKGVGLNMFWIKHYEPTDDPSALYSQTWKTPNGQSHSLLE